MRRYVLAVAALLPLLSATGCEDGPNQTFSPAPAGAASVWNGNSGTGGIPEAGIWSNKGTEQFDAGFGGQNANITCTADEAKQKWNKYFQEPIQLPGLAGGLDIAGGVNGDGASNWQPGDPLSFYDPSKETWKGATVEQAEKILCTGFADSIYYGITTTIGWGNGCPTCELSVLYNSNNRIITDLLFQYGYAASIPATSADGKSTYAISLNNVPMTKTTNGTTTQLIIDWKSGPAAYGPIVNELYDALRATYTPQFPAEADCQATGHCIVGNNYSQGGYFWFVPQSLVAFVTNTLAPQPAASTITLVDLILSKVMPWSLGNITMKLDNTGEGPLVTTPNIAGSGKTGVYKIGMKWTDFDSQLLGASPTASVNAASKAKLFGALAHTDEAYEFNIVGIDPQFAADLTGSKATTVIGDKDLPSGNDTAYELTVDQQALGPIANDYINNNADPPSCTGGMCQLSDGTATGQTCQAAGDCQTQDWHGFGMIMLEWANLVQKFMTANWGVTSKGLGDPDCLCLSMTACNSPDKPANGKVCSGIEGIITPAPTALAPAQMAPNALGTAAVSLESQYAHGLKPSTWVSDFCTNFNDPTTCTGGTYGGPLGGFFFDSMQYAVSVPYGAKPIPYPLNSRRFFFQQWILAVIKYMQTAANPNATLAQIDANPVDANQLFFDSAGGGFENGNYVFRNTVNSVNQPPTILNVSTNLTTSVLNNFTFSRYNFRGDVAMYSALTTNASDQLGAEPLYITNLAGSPVLQAAYPTSQDDAGAPVGGYECAVDTTGTDPNCSGAKAPVDPITGKALYAPYKGAFGATVFNIAANGANPTPSAMTITGITDYELIQSAMVTLPIWSNPYDPTSAMPGKDKTISALLPFVPKGASAGFPVTIDGSRDKFYNTNETLFTSAENLAGSSFETTVDWEYVANTSADGGGVGQELVVRGLESQSYLGLIFACAQGPDILAIRMYDNVTTILSWIANHPSSIGSCGIQLKYSLYGNYADDVSFLSNGVRIGFNPGFGGSVASDGTLFDPNVVATLGQ